MSKKPKLVLFSAFYEPYMSGAEQMVRQIAENFGDKYELVIITGRYNRKNSRQEKRSAYKIERIGIGHKQIDKFLYIILAPLTAVKHKPQIIHAIMESYTGGALVLSKYINKNAKRILTLQSGDLDDKQKQEKVIISFFWRLIHLSPDVVTAISSFLAKRAEKLGVSKEKIFITPNGIDYSEIDLTIKKEKELVLCMGRLSWEKGYDYLLPAWKQVVQKHPGAILEIWGDGPKKKDVEKMISDLDLNDTVKTQGVVPHAQFMKKMARAEIFVLPSLAEGLGNVFIEAQASGVVPIGTRVGGIIDVIKDGENGILVESKNSNQITEALLKLLENDSERNRMKEEGLENSKKFSWPIILKRFDEIYKFLLDERK